MLWSVGHHPGQGGEAHPAVHLLRGNAAQDWACGHFGLWAGPAWRGEPLCGLQWHTQQQQGPLLQPQGASLGSLSHSADVGIPVLLHG